MPRDANPQRILITDGNERASLAAARALVASGYAVIAVAPTRRSLASASQGVQSQVVAIDPLVDPARYAEAVGRMVGDLDVQVVLPITDASVEALLEHRGALPSNATLPLPDLATYRAASDKALVTRLAAEVGFDVPETVTLRSPSDTARLPDAGFFPAVIKPHRSVVAAEAGRQKTAVLFADDVAECRRALATVHASAYPVLLQRRVLGRGEGVFALVWNGDVIACFCHRRLREKPPAGGVSVYRESIPPEPELVAPGLGLLRRLQWRGVAMIECKRDRATGRPVLIEVNGRMWGSLQLAVDAGVDFPTLLVRCALGQPVAKVQNYRVGIRSRWFWGDVDHLYLRLTRSARALHLEPGSPSRTGALAAFLQFDLDRDRCELWRRDDPGPFFLETARRLKLARLLG